MMIVDFDPIIFSLGPIVLRWYALAYIAGFLLGRYYILMLIRGPARAIGITVAHIDTFFIVSVIAVILGGRLGYVLFYNPAYYMAHPLQILMIWQGGMAFHGGLAGMGLAIWWFSRRHNIITLALADMIAAAAPCGLFFGRIANFVNAELWGHPTTLPIGVIFPRVDQQPRHPSQLYEAALEGLVLWAILYFAIFHYRALARHGLVTGVMLGLYSIFRFWAEFFRVADAQLGLLAWGLSMGQWLSMATMLGAVAVLLSTHRSLANDY